MISPTAPVFGTHRGLRRLPALFNHALRGMRGYCADSPSRRSLRTERQVDAVVVKLFAAGTSWWTTPRSN
ncbi:hypothetical protein KCP73_17735 [Salmonella enterica subsp. enterica]|nr:hypothetical protein KCP73_17735 [Salmonella enterica subsp. enterica]